MTNSLLSFEEICNLIVQEPICEPDNGLVIEWPAYIKSSGKFSRCIAYLSGSSNTAKWLIVSYKGEETAFFVIADTPREAVEKLLNIIRNF